MIVRLVVVGKVKERFTREWLDEFGKRLARFVSFDVVELRESSIEAEAAALLRVIRDDDFVVLFDVGGEQLSSEEFARLIGRVDSKRLVLVIGGPAGVSDDVRKRAQRRLSLSRMTFTHQLARLLVTEQLYRACTILHGGSYHK